MSINYSMTNEELSFAIRQTANALKVPFPPGNGSQVLPDDVRNKLKEHMDQLLMCEQARAFSIEISDNESADAIDPEKEKRARETMERQGLINTICKVFKVPVSSVASRDGTETERKPSIPDNPSPVAPPPKK